MKIESYLVKLFYEENKDGESNSKNIELLLNSNDKSIKNVVDKEIKQINALNNFNISKVEIYKLKYSYDVNYSIN